MRHSQHIPTKSTIMLAFCLLLFTLSAAVFALNDSTFDSLVKDHQPAFLNIFSPALQPAAPMPLKAKIPRHVDKFASSGSKIIQLTPQNFASTLASYPYVFVDFYYPNCPHCKKLAPIFAKAANANTNPNVQFATFNGHLDESRLDRLHIKQVPALFLFKGPNNWTPFRAKNNITADDLTNFVSKNTGNKRN